MRLGREHYILNEGTLAVAQHEETVISFNDFGNGSGGAIGNNHLITIDAESNLSNTIGKILQGGSLESFIGESAGHNTSRSSVRTSGFLLNLGGSHTLRSINNLSTGHGVILHGHAVGHGVAPRSSLAIIGDIGAASVGQNSIDIIRGRSNQLTRLHNISEGTSIQIDTLNSDIITQSGGRGSSLRDAFRTVSEDFGGFAAGFYHPQVRFVPLFPPRFFCSWVTAWVAGQTSPPVPSSFCRSTHVSLYLHLSPLGFMHG